MNLRDMFLTRRYFRLFLGVLALALALGWSKLIGGTYYIPNFDYFDTAIGLIVGIYLIYSWMAEPIQSNRMQKQNAKTINQ